ncbi:MAG: hypothetical protein FWC73_09135 [Defluviitaleaceae bacterium]|nr:hypothetical protein [Defluviitaleaceae bacterium]
MKRYRVVFYFTLLTVMLALVSCSKDSVSSYDNHREGRAQDVGSAFIPPSEDRSDIIISAATNYVIGDFQYPENPAKQLRTAIENNVKEYELPMAISDIERIEFNNREYTQIKVDFTDSGNIGVILFLNRYLGFDVDVLLDERENPSFAIAFKNHDNYQDMIMLLTSIIMYLSPELCFEEATRLATLQDRTISIDGYSMPVDINGYQIQARYTNPHVFLHTPYFDAMLGIRVRAIKQLWQGVLYTDNFQHLTGPHDYHMLNISFWDESRHPEGVYADFIVKNTWQYKCWRHGRTLTIVDVESMSGRQLSLGLDSWERFHDPYEFGVGQKYTIFIELRFNQGIVYAIQRSESMEFNSRGQAQSADMLSLEFIDSVIAWPDGEGTVLEVHFQTYAFGSLNIFYVLEGYGLGGTTVWPIEEYYPIWDDYTFLGWFDNPYFSGEPYTNNTPIYLDTNLFPKWRYSGPGGIWPRAYRGIIHGIGNESTFSAGQTITITAEGYNMNLELPQDKRFRWMPISWNLSNGVSGVFMSEGLFQADITFDNIGEQWLYITYLEEVFDRTRWQETGQIREVRERLLIIQ